jgi:hypothetical protein
MNCGRPKFCTTAQVSTCEQRGHYTGVALRCEDHSFFSMHDRRELHLRVCRINQLSEMGAADRYFRCLQESVEGAIWSVTALWVIRYHSKDLEHGREMQTLPTLLGRDVDTGGDYVHNYLNIRDETSTYTHTAALFCTGHVEPIYVCEHDSAHRGGVRHNQFDPGLSTSQSGARTRTGCIWGRAD